MVCGFGLGIWRSMSGFEIVYGSSFELDLVNET